MNITNNVAFVSLAFYSLLFTFTVTIKAEEFAEPAFDVLGVE